MHAHILLLLFADDFENGLGAGRSFVTDEDHLQI